LAKNAKRKGGVTLAIDQARLRQRAYGLQGWAFHESGQIEGVSLHYRDGRFDFSAELAYGQPRPDLLEQGLPTQKLHCGFYGSGLSPYAYKSLPLIRVQIAGDEGTKDYEEFQLTAEDLRDDKGSRRTPKQKNRRRGWRKLKAKNLRKLRRPRLKLIPERAILLDSASPPTDKATRPLATQTSWIAKQRLSAFRRFAKTRAEKVLIFDHNGGGGANEYSRQLIDVMKSQRKTVFRIYFDVHRQFFRLEVNGHFDYGNIISFQEENIFWELGKMKFDLLIINTLHCFPSIVNVLKFVESQKINNNIRLINMMHEFMPICPSFYLIDETGKYCGVPSTWACQGCLPRNRATRKHPTSFSDIAAWRTHWFSFLQSCDEVIYFSHITKDLLLKAFPDLPTKNLIYRPHKIGMNFGPISVHWHNDKTKIGVVGNINYAKGAVIICGIQKIIDDNDLPFSITVIGSLRKHYNRAGIKVVGAYRQVDLPKILKEQKIDICLFPSIWPETFSYVVEELRALRMPIVAFDLGAPAERLRRDPHVRLVPRIDCALVVRALESLEEELRSNRNDAYSSYATAPP
jgi:glycosyltransferase involved in cell wall biosynthesis